MYFFSENHIFENGQKMEGNCWKGVVAEEKRPYLI